jgi:predicted dehydrogenase
VPGIECVAVCDLYDSRHEAAQESVKKQVPATRNYHEILDRKDVDAVIVAVADHQHRRVVVDACAAGKDVYCEKPMSHTIEDGFAMVDAVHKGNRIMQVGSQRVSSIVYQKAHEIVRRRSPRRRFLHRSIVEPQLAQRGVGVSNSVRRQRADHRLECFPGGAPQRPFDAARFFRWRCFADYGEGLAGDLFVHLLSGIHFITGTNEVAARAQSSGGLFRFKDGRDFPDLIETVYDYPKFRVSLWLQSKQRGRRTDQIPRHKRHHGNQWANPTFTPQDVGSPKPEGIR